MKRLIEISDELELEKYIEQKAVDYTFRIESNDTLFAAIDCDCFDFPKCEDCEELEPFTIPDNFVQSKQKITQMTFYSRFLEELQK